MFSRSTIISNNISKPTSTVDINTLTNELNNMTNNTTYKKQAPVKNENLWNFLRMYKICTIPLFDFILVYIVLYFINSVYTKYNYIYIIILAIIITLLINYFINTIPIMK